MKSPVAQADITTNIPTAERKTMVVKGSAKVFDIFFDKVYSKKAKAVSRESMTNADDAHRMVGTDRPFVVHLPDELDPTFSVRDFGPGMSYEFMMGDYTEAFNSSKDEDNTQTGMLGIGSKAGLALSDAYTVTCYQGGRRWQYLVSRDEDRLPGVLPLTDVAGEPTEEPDGVEVQIPVADSLWDELRSETEKLVTWFPTPPLGVAPRTWEVAAEGVMANGYTWQVGKYDAANSGWRRSSSNLPPHVIRQGPIVYPVDLSALETEETGDLSVLDSGDYTLVIDVPIGTADIGPDRESLSYDHVTQANLVEVMKLAQDGFRSWIEERIGESPNWLTFCHAAAGMDDWVPTWVKSEYSLDRIGSSFLFGGSDWALPSYLGKGWLSEDERWSPGLGPRIHPADPRRADYSDEKLVKLGWPNSQRYDFSRLERTAWYVVRPGVVRARNRVRKHFDATYGVSRAALLDNPTLRQLERLVTLTGISWDDLIFVDQLPDCPPPKRAPQPKDADGKPIRKASLSGVYNLRNGIDLATELPEEYLWVAMPDRASGSGVKTWPSLSYTSPRAKRGWQDHSRTFTSVTNAQESRYQPQGTLYRQVEADFLEHLGLPTALIGFTESARERFDLDPARQLHVALQDALVTQEHLDRLSTVQVLSDVTSELVDASDRRLTPSLLELLGVEVDGVTASDLRDTDHWASWYRTHIHRLCEYLGRGYRSGDQDLVRTAVAAFQDEHPVFFIEQFTTDHIHQYNATGTIS